MSVLSISPTVTRKVVAALVAFLLVSVAIVRTSDAAFSAQVSNDGNAFATGDISLEADRTAPLFGDQTVTPAIYADTVNLAAGDVRVGCIEITYTGSFDANSLTQVNLAVSEATTDPEGLVSQLGAALAITGSCDDDPSNYGTSGPLADLAGDTGWTPSANEETRAFHFRVTVGEDAPQGATASGIDLTWSIATSTN